MPLDFRQTVQQNPRLLAEAAVLENLRRSAIELHPRLANSLVIYQQPAALSQIYQGYITIAKQAQLPLLLCTPTWRASPDRLQAAGIEQEVNGDAVRFLQQLRQSQGEFANKIFVGGLIGCKNDCYRPDEALSFEQAYDFHQWQIARLNQAGVDYLIAQTLPALSEARGIAKAMAASQRPFVISFVINRQGKLLDGTSLEQAINVIDQENPPFFYAVNCAYPSFLPVAELPAATLNRIQAYFANASAKDCCELDNAEHLQAEKVSDWGDAMLTLNRHYGTKILGGCCGTDDQHLRYLTQF